jgi:hypothetical protein
LPQRPPAAGTPVPRHASRRNVHSRLDAARGSRMDRRPTCQAPLDRAVMQVHERSARRTRGLPSLLQGGYCDLFLRCARTSPTSRPASSEPLT